MKYGLTILIVCFAAELSAAADLSTDAPSFPAVAVQSQLYFNSSHSSEKQRLDIAKKLRADINDVYHHSRDLPPYEANKLLTKKIKEYFPPEMSFAEAESILGAAGFKINTDPYHFPQRKGVRESHTEGSIVIEESILTMTSVYIIVSIFPFTDNDFSKISRVEATSPSVSP